MRYREDEFIDPKGEVTQVRARLTLIGEEERQGFDNAVMLSRSRFLAAADRSLRFYQEYFDPKTSYLLIKIVCVGALFIRERISLSISIVSVKPELPGYYLEIKSRTWSVSDAERKAGLIVEILELFGVAPEYG